MASYVNADGVNCRAASADRIDRVMAISVDVIVDFIGTPNLARNIRSINYGGRLVQVGILGGVADATLPLDLLLYRHLRIIGTVMKSRAQDVKHGMVARFGTAWLEHLANGAITAVIGSVYALEEASETHRRMETGASFGKIILQASSTMVDLS